MLTRDLIAPIPELLRRRAAQFGQKAAFSDAGESVSYQELDRLTANLGGHLKSLGLAFGDSVAIYLPNSVAWVEACLGTARAGGMGVPINYDAPEPEVAYRLRDANCRFLVTTDERHDLALAAAKGQSLRIILVSREGHPEQRALRLKELLTTPPPEEAPDPAFLHEPSFIVYTSGTTGQAKGVLLSVHGLLWSTAANWVDRVGLNCEDRFLSMIPLFHSYALNTSVLTVLALGASAHLCERFSPKEAVRLLDEGGFTFLPGVPTVFQYLLNGTPPDRPPFPKLRICITGGAPMPLAVMRQFEERFKVPLLDGYGITETSTFLAVNGPSGERRPGSSGLPFAGLAVRIVDPKDGRDMDAGAEGEIIVRGPTVMAGYLDKPAETAATVRQGWYHTGDLGRFDEDGFLYVTGRLKEIIIRGGQNISPAEVEEAVLQFPAVADVAALARPHPDLGEVPVVAVVEREGMTFQDDDLLRHCRAMLSSYKIPAAIYRVPEIPRTGSGKIIRHLLSKKLIKDETPS